MKLYDAGASHAPGSVFIYLMEGRRYITPNPRWESVLNTLYHGREVSFDKRGREIEPVVVRSEQQTTWMLEASCLHVSKDVYSSRLTSLRPLKTKRVKVVNSIPVPFTTEPWRYYSEQIFREDPIGEELVYVLGGVVDPSKAEDFYRVEPSVNTDLIRSKAWHDDIRRRAVDAAEDAYLAFPREQRETLDLSANPFGDVALGRALLTAELELQGTIDECRGHHCVTTYGGRFYSRELVAALWPFEPSWAINVFIPDL